MGQRHVTGCKSGKYVRVDEKVRDCRRVGCAAAGRLMVGSPEGVGYGCSLNRLGVRGAGAVHVNQLASGMPDPNGRRRDH